MKAFSAKRHVLILVADQSPKIPEKSYWTSFLPQRTAFLNGTELNTAHDKTSSLFAKIIYQERISAGNAFTKMNIKKDG